MYYLLKSGIFLIDKEFRAVVLPVGQGDCVAMYCPNGNLVMFDCGSSMREKGLTEEVKGLLMNKKVKKVTIFISHGDVDHYKYLPTVFNDLTKIDGVIIGGHPKDHDGSETIKKWMLALAQNNKCFQSCSDKLHIVKLNDLPNQQGGNWVSDNIVTKLKDMDICGNKNIRFDIIAANVGKQKNRKSIVLRVSAKKSMLLAGDMEGSAAKTVTKASHNRLKSDIYQISHHGASTMANKFEWLDAVQPKEAFVSHAYKSKYGHPRCEAIRNLISIGSLLTNTIYFTHTHSFTCAERRRKDKKYVNYDGEICHHIYSTSPANDVICMTRFYLDNDLTIHHCFKLHS